MRRAVALLLMLALAAPAWGQEAPRVPLRVGSHADHGRLVFDWPGSVGYTVEQQGERILLRFAAPGRIDLEAARRPPRNVLGVTEEDGALVIRAAPGARLRHFRLGSRVVVDLLDSTAPEAAAPARAEPPRRSREQPAAPGAPPARQAVAAEAVPAGETRAGSVPAASGPAGRRGAAASAPAALPAPAAVPAPARAPGAGPMPTGRARATASAAPPVAELSRTAQPGASPGSAVPLPAGSVDAVSPNAALPGAAPRAATSPNAALPNAAPLDMAPPGAASANAALPNAAPPSTTPPNATPPNTTRPDVAPPNAAPSNATPSSTTPANAAAPGPAPRHAASSNAPPPSAAPRNPARPNAAPAGAAPFNAAGPSAAPQPSAPPPHAPVPNAPATAGLTSPPAAIGLAPPGAAPVRPLRDAPAIAVPAADDSGLALFRRGEMLHAVFDSALTIDLTPLRGHPVFAGLEALPAGGGTLLRLRLAAPARLLAHRDGAAWVLEATRDTPADAENLRVVAEPGPPARLLLQGGLDAAAAGGVVALADPETGEPLLVATLRRAGPGVALGRRLPELEILPSIMGAAVLARSDRVVLRPAGDRILVQAAGGGSLALGALGGREPPAQAVAMTRLLDLPVAPVPALMERLRMQLLTVNEAPPLGRGTRRRDAAETLLALGLPQEAQAMASLALREDPQVREDARLILAQGAAALLAGRPAEARGIADPRLPALDEVALWRALLATAEGDATAAPALIAGAPLLLAYPEALRARLLPLALETMAAGGEAASAARLLAEAGDLPGLDLARALLAEAEGRGVEALQRYAAVAAGRDRRQRAVALRRAAELRLARGETDSAGAAAALEQALFAWRGGAEELAARRRIAALRMDAGQGPQAFAMLEETSRLFPEQAAALRPKLAAAFAAALETAPPLLATALFDAHPDLLPEGGRGEAAVLLLADRLAALDLPGRAAALLDGAASRVGPAGRAALGARLAALRLEAGETAAALAALDSTAAEGLPDALVTQRALLRARVLARRGARQEAAALLAGLGPAGAEARADLFVEAQDWPAAAAAQREHLAALLPPAPAPLGPAERAAVARAAAYAALAGEEEALAALREAHGARMEGGPLAEAFAVLTSDPLRGVADLPRLQREIGVLRQLPSRLEALRGPVPVAR